MLGTFFKRLFNKQPQLLDVGAPAPVFEVLDHTGATLRSSELAGKPYVLWFYPKADTPG